MAAFADGEIFLCLNGVESLTTVCSDRSSEGGLEARRRERFFCAGRRMSKPHLNPLSATSQSG